MKIKQMYSVVKQERLSDTGKKILQKYHYSGSYRATSQLIYSLFRNGIEVGVALFGHVNSMRAAKKYGNCLELKKFCLIDNTRRNTESYFLGSCIRDIKRNQKDIKGILTYADPNHGHSGVIYRASNFTYLGQGKKNRFYHNDDGNEIHERAMYQRSSKTNQYLPSAVKLQKMKNTGELTPKMHEGKHIYFFNF